MTQSNLILWLLEVLIARNSNLTFIKQLFFALNLVLVICTCKFESSRVYASYICTYIYQRKMRKRENGTFVIILGLFELSIHTNILMVKIQKIFSKQQNCIYKYYNFLDLQKTFPKNMIHTVAPWHFESSDFCITKIISVFRTTLIKSWPSY